MQLDYEKLAEEVLDDLIAPEGGDDDHWPYRVELQLLNPPDQTTAPARLEFFKMLGRMRDSVCDVQFEIRPDAVAIIFPAGWQMYEVVLAAHAFKSAARANGLEYRLSGEPVRPVMQEAA